jgi:acetate kinase
VAAQASSLKAEVVEHDTGKHLAGVRIQRIGDVVADHQTALSEALPGLLAKLGDATVGAVGHRVVHGGQRYVRPTPISAEVLAGLDALIPLAPLHNPANIAGIRAALEILPDLPHIAVFDTAFHATLPPRARTYALPIDLAEKHQIRRYGFHGTSHAYVAERAADFLGSKLINLRVITCHLGNGCSVAAIENGRSVETSMGMTPLEGLVMGTRSGDVDVGAILHLARCEGWSLDQLDKALNKTAGLAGLSGCGNDFRDISERASAGDERCRLAIQVFCHRLRKYIGAYAAVMGGVDAIVFTGGIGENSALVRHRVAQRLDFLGASIDEDKNRDGRPTTDTPVVDLSRSFSRVRLLSVATDEQHAIAREAAGHVLSSKTIEEKRPIPVAVSARHIHLNQEAVEALFGEGHQLTPRNPLSQPGQYACEELLTVVGPKRSIERVRVLGPTRSACQVEVSRTDEFFLGVDAPVRQSGHVDHTPGVTLVGPAGEFQLSKGLICAWRHIHMRPQDAEYYGVTHGDIVEVAIDSDNRNLIFGDVMVRVKDSYALEMHIDTDEANAAELQSGHGGMLVGTRATATLRRVG